MEGYSLGKAPRNKASREKKIRKIKKILAQEYSQKPRSLLDIGTGGGFIAASFAADGLKVSSVDVVDYRVTKKGYTFKLVNDEVLPFKDKSFDIVISNQVIEHVPNASLHLREMKRVIKDDGIIYLASPNKFWLTDPHYKLPFISWLPRRVSGWYLRICRGKKWDIYSLSLSRLRKLTRQNGLTMKDYSWNILKHADMYDLKISPTVKMFVSRAPHILGRIFVHITPTHVKIVRKAK